MDMFTESWWHMDSAIHRILWARPGENRWTQLLDDPHWHVRGWLSHNQHNQEPARFSSRNSSFGLKLFGCVSIALDTKGVQHYGDSVHVLGPCRYCSHHGFENTFHEWTPTWRGWNRLGCRWEASRWSGSSGGLVIFACSFYNCKW